MNTIPSQTTTFTAGLSARPISKGGSPIQPKKDSVQCSGKGCTPSLLNKLKEFAGSVKEAFTSGKGSSPSTGKGSTPSAPSGKGSSPSAPSGKGSSPSGKGSSSAKKPSGKGSTSVSSKGSKASSPTFELGSSAGYLTNAQILRGMNTWKNTIA
ncbi:MAG: hypothetical protein HYU64_12330 [Armatimonadetes bacterium]|nr:hypothetical protein [Armatimonadota bacterium]